VRVGERSVMTLQKIADAVGVSVGKVHSVASDLIFNSEIENERGQLRPMHYAARTVAAHRPARMTPSGPRTGAAAFCGRKRSAMYRRMAYSGFPLTSPLCVCAAPSNLATRVRNSASSARSSFNSASPANAAAICSWAAVPTVKRSIRR